MERYLIGTSLSMCLRDIIKGRVREENVALIVTGTKHPFESDPDYVWELDGNRQWTDEESEILHRLWKQGRIHQPRKVSSCYENSRSSIETVMPCGKRHWYRLSPADTGEDR